MAPPIAIGETGVAPSALPIPPAGSFVSLPPAPSALRSGERGGVLLALPKLANGSIATGFKLAPGAHVASSYFSAVLCSTVVHIVGAPDSDPAALIETAPSGSAVVRNDVYVTAAAALRPVGTGRDPYRDLEYALDVAQVDAARSVTDGTGARVVVLDSAPACERRFVR